MGPITTELRSELGRAARAYGVDEVTVALVTDQMNAIDAVHESLERENEELHKYPLWAPESHYMMLPKDTDGVPIHVGDVMEWVDIEGTVEVTCTVEAVGVGCFFAWDKANGRYAQKLATSYRHHHADSWEQIIEDALDGYHDTDFDALVARCKALAGDADE